MADTTETTETTESTVACERMRTMVQAIAVELVDEPDEVDVTTALSKDGQIVTVTVRTAAGEQGKVIGRHGQHAQRIRALLEAVAAKHKLRAQLEIADAQSNKRRREHRAS